MADRLDLTHINTFLLEGAPTFVIDGRSYTDPDAVRADLKLARAFLNERRIGFEWDCQPIAASAPASYLPTWQQFRKSFV